MGWLDGAVRMTPNWETSAFGHTISWNILIPALIIPGIMFTLLGLYPWIESWVTGDKREHHLLDRPRNAPVRTGLGVMSIVFYLMLWINSGNDILATAFNLSINQITWSFRVLIFILPPVSFVITKRICLSLQRRDNDKLLHGYETGRILRLPHGEFIEIHEPISAEEAAIILGKADVPALAIEPAEDVHGVRNPKARSMHARARLSQWFYKDNVPAPTQAELDEARAHQEHALHAAADAGAIESH